jgi:transcriptional regulator with XRE-family HTH domain
MKMLIGKNIKRRRTEKGVTQEQLAEAMNVTCAAVSKWERSETYPDITLIQPLAFYFGVSLDELMGYDKEKVNEEIDRTIAEYRKCLRSDWEKAQQMIIRAYKDYPNDYRIMFYYMWSFGVSDAEPDLENARAHKDEIGPICDRIIEGCTDVQFCLGAWKMKAILLHAEGKTEEALRIHEEKFGGWYYSSGQMNEQLFTKDRPEFLYWAKRNMYELVEFAADKLVKSCFFDPEIPYEKMVETVEKIGDGVFRLGCETENSYLLAQAKTIFGRLHNDLIARETRGGKEEDIIRITDKYLTAVDKLSELAKTDVPLFDAVVKSHHTDDLLSYTIDCAFTWKHPRNIALLENEAYRSVIEKYRR